VARLAPAALAALLALALLRPGGLEAQERSHRLFAADQGLNPPSVRSLAQDRAGFLWIGSEAGLLRYDGVQMRRWGGGTLDRAAVRIAPSPDGGLVALLAGGALFAVGADGARPVPGPDGRPITGARDAAFDASGGLWIVRPEAAWRRHPDAGAWTRFEVKLADGDLLRLVRAHAGDAVHVVSRLSVWRLRPGQPAVSLPIPPDLDPPVMDVQTTADGRVLAVSFLGRVLELGEEGARELFRTSDLGAPGRAISVAERGGTIWIAVDRYLVGWRPGSPTTVLGPEESVEGGGPLLVDREGSLWLGSFAGLYQFPDPDVPLWTERSGLPTSHVRYLARAARTVWVTTWLGGAYIRREGAGWTTGTLPGWTPSPAAVDSRGVLWAGSQSGLLEVGADGVGADGGATDVGVRAHLGGPASLFGFHEEPNGAIWLATSLGLFHSEAPGGPLAPVAVTAFGGEGPVAEAVLVDRAGALWATSGETVCHVPAERAARAAEAEWSCDSIPGAVHVSGDGLVEMPSGALWLSTNRLGVLRRGDAGWEPVPGARELPSRSILSLVPAASGGVWVVGHGALRRVEEAIDDPAGWVVRERLTSWHGLPAEGGNHVLEDDDGGLWVTTALGVAHVPAAARFQALAPPPVALVNARVDDEEIPLRATLELPHDRNRLELRFAALSFRDPSLLSYQVRLSPDDPWVNTAGAPFFRWVDLPPGRYAAEARASLDGANWSASAARFAFRVAPPWYRRPWALALFAAVAGALLYAAHRLRLNHLLELERQRTRIAMDLHDEIGSGLGSIGILSGLLASDRADAGEKRRLAGEIALTSRDLSAALGQIVWTLDPRSRTLEELAGRLIELGRRLFTGTPTELNARTPANWPEVRLGQLTRRNVLLIGLEALHNAARHARASRVEVGLTQRGDGAWQLEVADDGVGLEDGGHDQGGMGLRSMRRRAEEIGAQIDVRDAEGGGTRVLLTFRPRRRSRRGAA